MIKAFILALAGMLLMSLTGLTDEPGLLQLIHIGGLVLIGVAAIIILNIDKKNNNGNGNRL